MDRYTSGELQVPVVEGEPEFENADLIFDGVDHSGDSYEAHVFFDNAEADENTPRDLDNGYAGRFVVFGHGGCAGDVGHCDIETEQDDPDDMRLPHPLTPSTKPVRVTEALRARTGETFTVSVVPVVADEDGVRRADVLHFKALVLVTYD